MHNIYFLGLGKKVATTFWKFGYEKMGVKSKKRKKLWEKIKICFVCRDKILRYEDSSIEHVIPKSKGGTDRYRNLTLSHRKCNSKRGNIACRLVWELKLKKLIKKPRRIPLPKDIEKAWLQKLIYRLENS